ncbi:uncharacterized protein METZ01_LOCUS429357 [marine metagenome]|uniref:Uncharacterized protein n=1 Tax=marine metagenome TaxID=408172 RepID=A0A382XZU9_9ZZZZ
MKYGTKDFTIEALFRFLDTLRESGEINMFGAPKVMEQHLGLSSQEAKDVWVAWTETYKEEGEGLE